MTICCSEENQLHFIESTLDLLVNNFEFFKMNP